MGNPGKIKAAIYVRISRDAREDGLGVKRQREDCEQLAASLNWDVARIFEDNDVSATSGKPRPQFEAMKAAIETGQVNAVVVWDVDRLTRSPRELEDVIDWADRLGLKLASVGGPIDLATEQGRMFARMKGSVARYEVEQASRRIKRKRKQMAIEGVPLGPRAFGWDRVAETTEDGKTVLVERINPVEADIVREATRRVLAGDSLWRITCDFNKRGIKTSTGADWRTGTLRTVLKRPRNIGARVYKGEIANPNAFPPILDEDTYTRLMALLNDPTRVTNNRGTELRYLLTSKARCGACGGYLVGKKEYSLLLKNGRKRTYPASYICPKAGCMKVTRNMQLVDDIVNGVVVGVLKAGNIPSIQGNPQMVDAAANRIEALNAKLSLAADEFAGDKITMDQLQRITATIRPLIEAAEKERASALPRQGELDGLIGGSAAQVWESLNLDRKRKVIDVLGLLVTIMPVGPGNTSKAGAESVKISWRGSDD